MLRDESKTVRAVIDYHSCGKIPRCRPRKRWFERGKLGFKIAGRRRLEGYYREKWKAFTVAAKTLEES